MTLQAICDRLETMRERTPRGRSKWGAVVEFRLAQTKGIAERIGRNLEALGQFGGQLARGAIVQQPAVDRQTDGARRRPGIDLGIKGARLARQAEIERPLGQRRRPEQGRQRRRRAK